MLDQSSWSSVLGPMRASLAPREHESAVTVFFPGLSVPAAMSRIFIAGVLLLLGAAIATRSKTETLVFVFRGLDPAHNVAILRPMIAPDIGVQVDSGATKLQRGAVL